MKRKKHIVFIVENLSVPFDRRVWREANVMYDAGYRISVICPKGLNQDKRSKEIIDGIYIYRYSIPLMQDSKWGYIKEYLKAFFCTFYLLLKINFRHKVHVIHVANPLDIFFPLGWIKKLLRIKFIFDQHDLCPESYLVKYSISKSSMIYKILLWFERQTYNVSDVVVSTNQSIKDIAVERGNIKPDNIFIVRNGPDSDFKKVPVNISVKNNFKYMAAYIGVMGAPDGVENIIYSADYLINTKSYKDIFYILIGYGDEYENIKALISELELSDYFSMPGRISDEDVLTILSAADVCLAPDPKNGLNEFHTMNKIMDYMRMGKPIVSFDLLESKYSAESAAIYVKNNKFADFGDAIIYILENPEVALKMGTAGIERVNKFLKWEISKKELINAYNQLFSI
jgi:glycosyltransferase involved in cell wall biosynthesis